MTRILDWLREQMLATGEDDGRRGVVDQLRQADDHARAIFALGSPLAVGDDNDRVIEATRVLVCGKDDLDDMDGDINGGQYDHDAVTGECLLVSIEAAYRLGIAVGLRLADLADDVAAPTTPAPAEPEVTAVETPALPTPEDAPATDVDTPEVDVDAVARAFVRRFGTGAVDVDFDDDDESTRLHELIPRSRDSAAEHTRWYNALEAIKTKHHLAFAEFDGVESSANGAAGMALEEGYVFRLAVGRQLRAKDAPRGDEQEELAALRNVVGGGTESGGDACPSPSPPRPHVAASCKS